MTGNGALCRGEPSARPCENGHSLPLAQAAAVVGRSPRSIARLAARSGDRFIVKRGSRGRGKSALVDLAVLRALLGEQSPDPEAQRAVASFANRLLDEIGDTLAESFHNGSLRTAINATTPAAARAALYAWHTAALAISFELRRSGIAQPISELPSKMVTLRRF